MPNPFLGQPFIDSADELYGREEQLSLLKAYFKTRADAVLFGPEGSGKSTLLRCFFSRTFRQKMAKKNTLIYLGEFQNNLSGEDTYGFFADAIRTAVDFLEVCGMFDEKEALLKSLDATRFDTKQSRFDQYLNKISNFGYRMVFVLDNFENFTSSLDVKPEHHDLLCGMLNDDKLQLIVATNFDFNETSLPVGTRNSKLLTRLSPHSIPMTPLTPAQCKSLLLSIAEDEDEELLFTDEQLQVLCSLSGGIPLLLNMAAKHGHNAIQEGAEDWPRQVRERTLHEAVPLLKHWCKVTPKDQLDLLSGLQENRDLPDDKKTVASALVERGLLQKGFVLGRDGHRIAADGYVYNSGLFRQFCGNQEWLDEVLERNPLRKEAAPAAVFDPLAMLQASTERPIVIEKLEVHNGDKYDHSVTNSLTYQPTVIADKGFERLFNILDLDRDELGGKLLEIFHNTPRSLPETIDPEIVAEETAERITSMFIPEEVESESLEQFQEEQKTLESRFNSIRAQVDPDGLVDDALLASLSKKCLLYLQIAFVVDDALSALKDFHLGDLSAQMVMYGKVLEQQLKDNLYQLFKKDSVLKDIDVFTNSTDPYSWNTFAAMKIKKTSIGNYMSLMRGQSQRLATLCLWSGIRHGNQHPDSAWWENLGDSVNAARDLRNGGDHAGTETSQSDLLDMRRLLFGDGQILQRCTVGKQLTQTLWPPAQPVVQNQPAGNDKDQLIGQTVNMTDIEATSRRGIRGIIEGTNHGVTVSPRHLADKNLDPQDFVGKTIQVKVLEWNDNPNAQKFVAEIV